MMEMLPSFEEVVLMHNGVTDVADNGRVELIVQQLNRIDQRLDRMEDKLDRTIAAMREDVEVVHGRIGKVERRTSELEGRVDTVMKVGGPLQIFWAVISAMFGIDKLGGGGMS